MREWLKKASRHDPLAAMRSNGSDGGAVMPEQSIGALRLHIDPSAKFAGNWRSPIGRLVELNLTLHSAPSWIAVHIDLPVIDLSSFEWFGFALRHGASEPMKFRAALRSHPSDGGPFNDIFFPQELSIGAAAADHCDLIAPTRQPDLPMAVSMRELVLFLPTISDFRWSLHDLRFIYL